jgi:hypothetical protein
MRNKPFSFYLKHILPARLSAELAGDSKQVFNGIFLAIFHDSWLLNTKNITVLVNHTPKILDLCVREEL